ncbi:uncharacterized protein [Haliotis cracherodii]|uniref:uncharacterized protein isoform X1 n=1 Tax=Haliotis cracherodii TaxID=6455 RepID=UPI0039ECFF35
MASADSTTDVDEVSTVPKHGKEYDAFISFNSADEKFVDDLLKHLESPDIGLKCVDHRRDFRGGQTIVGNVDEFIEKASKYVLVMSPNFVESEWCKWETEVMVTMSVEQKRDNIIPVLLKPCRIPQSLNTLTYIEVRPTEGSRYRWRERLVNSIKWTDLKVSKHKNRDMEGVVQRAGDKKDVFKTCVQKYKQDKGKFEVEKRALESSVRIAFDAVSKQISATLERQKDEKMDEIQRLMDTRQTPLVQKMKAAEDILKLMEKDLKDDVHGIKRLADLLDEYENHEQKLKQRSFLEFVKSDSLVQILTDQMSKFDVGHLREIDIPQLRSQRDRDNFLKEIRPSLDILPETTDPTPWNVIRCQDIKYDEKTVYGRRTILPDGSLLNRESPEPLTNPDRRLNKFMGAVGTTTLTTGGVYYWENKLDVDLEKELSKRNFVFAVALSTNGVFDESQVGDQLPTAMSIAARACADHEAVCLYVTKYTSMVYHKVLTKNRRGKWPAIALGFLLDTVRQRLTVYDVTKKEEITCVEKIGDVEEFTPQFAVFGGHAGSVKLSLITGEDTKISPEILQNIRKSIE